ncbi:hypothetical protein AVEN_28470-1 [Araneus ventricosus]|uniref:Reverse transcriptase domain-containing protein n=1 Tax=Araneus ventricosus TaxID=182803 RepID=A0A4Y2N3L4_ARAVE|nr:hypothetical protein AVEN_28470-1 [Araneus ventricosus]
MISESKEECFKEFLLRITQKKYFGKIKNGIKDKNSEIKIDQFVKEDGELTRDYKESRDFILRKHFPVIDYHYELTEEELPDIEKYKFTKQEIENSIKGMKCGGAPGYDGWTIELVEECYFTDSEWFNQVLNTCFINGFFPENWKTAQVILIPKEGKDLKDYKSYRPICLLPVWEKILDKLIANRLTYFLEENQILNNNEYGFRKYNSTINALQGVTDFIGESKALNKVTCLVSLDIEMFSIL